MRTVRQLAIEVEVGLRVVYLTLRKTVIAKLALAVGAALEAQTPNTAELAHRLPLDTERAGYARAVAAPLVEESIVQCGLLGTVDSSSAGGGECAGRAQNCS